MKRTQRNARTLRSFEKNVCPLPNPAKYLVLPTPMTYSRYRCYEILCLVYHESKLQVYVGIAKYLVLPTTITNSRNSIGVYKLLFLSTAKLQVQALRKTWFCLPPFQTRGIGVTKCLVLPITSTNFMFTVQVRNSLAIRNCKVQA